ncbi:MAG: hypothetical protein ABR548_08270 [Actinomycetota bacterium]|nr:hypothetical protein [Actinomycetota bacterium]
MGKRKPTTTFMVVPDGTGSKISRKVAMVPQGLMKLMAPMMGGMFRKRNVMFLENLKKTLEG